VATVPYGQPEHRSIASLHSYRLNGELVDAEANARFIARAVNSHDELIAALEEMIGWFGAGHQWDMLTDEMVERATAALARAKE
jgi:hypothetical protein